MPVRAYAYRQISTPLGVLGLVASPKGLWALLGPHDNTDAERAERDALRMEPPHEGHNGILDHWEDALTRYAAGASMELAGPLDMDGATEFQRAVWSALLTIPSGEVRTYGDVAQSIGRPRAARAVGQAVGSNRLGIVVP